MNSSSIEKRVQDLQALLESLSRDVEALSSQKNKLKSRLFRQRLQLAFFRSRTQAQKIADGLPVGKWFILLCVPAIVAAVSFVLTDIFLAWRTFSFVTGSVVWVSTIGILAVLLNGSKKVQLEAIVQQNLESYSNMLSQERRMNSREFQLREQIVASESDLKSALKELQAVQLRNSTERIRGDLYRLNWKAMRDVEFEQFLEKVFQALGYIVETTAVTGDQGVDLIVARDGIRVAIQVKGYHSSVGNGAIQEAFAGMAHYQCQACAAITNSRFTSSAVSLAKSTNCFLVDEDNFRDFVMGELDLVQSLKCQS